MNDESSTSAVGEIVPEKMRYKKVSKEKRSNWRAFPIFAPFAANNWKYIGL